MKASKPVAPAGYKNKQCQPRADVSRYFRVVLDRLFGDDMFHNCKPPVRCHRWIWSGSCPRGKNARRSSPDAPWRCRFRCLLPRDWYVLLWSRSVHPRFLPDCYTGWHYHTDCIAVLPSSDGSPSHRHLCRSS